MEFALSPLTRTLAERPGDEISYDIRVATVPVDLDADLVAKVQRVAGDDAVSAFVEAAVRRDLENEAFGRLLDEMGSEAGPVPEDLGAEASRFWRTS
jgi:Arc/MetJ family transcription regulator